MVATSPVNIPLTIIDGRMNMPNTADGVHNARAGEVDVAEPEPHFHRSAIAPAGIVAVVSMKATM